MQAHSTADEETKGLLEFYPNHPPRKDTPEYHATHKLLTHTLDQPCRDCGVRLSTLADPSQNPHAAKQMETHHWPLQREFADALDPIKVGKEYPKVTDRKSLNMFIDSPDNMLVLCDVDHRSPTRGIHHINESLEACKRFLIDGYILADIAKNQVADLAIDEALTSQEIDQI
ncbi:MAG: hypothetical protein QFB87_04455 [Patescibacteria group bacterium]|nr:hypothetical protein [Patescibacteria group bacterium]